MTDCLFGGRKANRPFREHLYFEPTVLTPPPKGFDLSINRYKEAKHEEVQHEPPKQIIARLRALEAEIAKDLDELEAML